MKISQSKQYVCMHFPHWYLPVDSGFPGWFVNLSGNTVSHEKQVFGVVASILFISFYIRNGYSMGDNSLNTATGKRWCDDRANNKAETNTKPQIVQSEGSEQMMDEHLGHS